VKQEKRNRTEFLRRFAKSFLLRLYDFSDPYTAMDLLLHSLANERPLVVQKLLRARTRADRVRNEFLQVKASILRSRWIQAAARIFGTCQLTSADFFCTAASYNWQGELLGFRPTGTVALRLGRRTRSR
jgi:hypothetical protein